ncbi:MAG: UDP-N-acetylmuramoyl-L-alanine--D-glutamate ligase [Saprospiraceae bacterium]|nr:UDP-N-acetylmuramoyl-L-alanine--D-glutamate ligase [Saprospiraceae bacterium]MDW8484260.1 UDP-N-acetylmuramoyl-L-alanine--D-glutamate ligase [Saprospiraceae bacterium]
MGRQHISILGAGESGTGAALLARHMGFEVRVSDEYDIKPAFRKRLEEAGIPYESGGHTLPWILGRRNIDWVGLAVKSPGIPQDAPVVKALRAQNVPIIGEIEFAYRFARPCKIVAITGTNGKTTTTTLTHHLLHIAGLNAYLAGNVGNSFAELVWKHHVEGNLDRSRIFVLEVSSFQLEDIARFKPNVAALLNITPDHLDRYGYDIRRYAAAKFRIRENQGPRDVFLYNAADPVSVDYLTRHSNWRATKVKAIHPRDIVDGHLRVSRRMFDLRDTRLIGPHNAMNALFAVHIALIMKADPAKIQEGLYTYLPPAHRMELVTRANGITWINDSKATNVDAAQYAISAIQSPVIWIAGGTDKGNDYTALIPLVRDKVRALVLLGADNSKLRQAFQPLGKPIEEVRTAEQAVAVAARLSQPGDTVLLSPACASFDLFKNFEDRGNQFREAVLKFTQKCI